MVPIQFEQGQTQTKRGGRLARRVLLVGWNGADRQTLLTLLQTGRLTHLHSLLQQGVRLELSVPQPAIAAATWTSLATGTLPHGNELLHRFAPSVSASGLTPVTSLHRTRPAIWDILGHFGRSSQVIGWPLIYPAERIAGICVADLAAAAASVSGNGSPSNAIVSPVELQPVLMSRRVAPAQLGEITVAQMLPRSASSLRQLPQLTAACRSILAEAATLFRMLRWSLRERPWDFAACVFPGLRRALEVAHWLQGVNPEAAQCADELVAGCYEHHDMLLGQLLQQVGEETHVLAVSLPAGIGVEGTPTGLAALRGPALRHSTESHRRSTLDVAPTVLTMLGAPYSADMAGRVWTELFDFELQPTAVEPGRIPGAEVEGADAAPPPTHENAAPQADASVEHLVRLGYIDPRELAEREAARNCRRDTTLQRAQSELAIGMLAAAIHDVHELLDEFPDSHRARAMLAECLFRAGRRDEARQQIEWLRFHGNERPQVYYLSAAIELADRNLPAALDELQGTRRGATRCPGSDLLEGKVRLRRREIVAARAAFESAIKHEGPSATALCGLAAVELLANAPEAAAVNALDALAADMRLGRAHYYLAVALTQLDRPQEALHAFETWAALEPLAAAPFRWMARVCERVLQDENRAAQYRARGRDVVRQRRRFKVQSTVGTSIPSSGL